MTWSTVTLQKRAYLEAPVKSEALFDVPCFKELKTNKQTKTKGGQIAG